MASSTKAVPDQTAFAPHVLDQHLEAIFDCGGEVELVGATAEGNYRERVSRASHRRGFPGMTLTKGSTHQLLEIACAYALAIFSPERVPYETWMSAEEHNDRGLVNCHVLRGERTLALAPEALVGTEILRWFEPRVDRTSYVALASYIPSPPQTRAVFRARRAVGDFFIEKRIPIPEEAPDWLVTLAEDSAENSRS